MVRIAIAAAALLAVTLTADPALADVASTLNTAGTNMITWVRSGAIIAFIIGGVMIAVGWRNIMMLGGCLVGLSIAIGAATYVGWIS